jgi:Holliday junction resolvase RusA-like endonuclease
MQAKTHSSLLAHIILNGTPKPARIKQKRTGQIYNSRTIHMTACKWKIKLQYRDDPYSGPVRIDYFFGFPIPKSWSEEQKELAAHEGIPHTVRPDYDNLKKLCNDCIKGIIVSDDAQMCSGEWRKEYTTTPRTEIWIYYK